MSEGEGEKPKVLVATKRGPEASRPLIVPFKQIHNEIISDTTSEKRRNELKAEMETRVREMEDLDIIKWRDVRAGLLNNVIKKSKWDEVYSDLLDYAKRAEDEARGVNVRLPEREKYHGVVQAAIEMAALEVSTQGMRRVGERPDFTNWLASHGKTLEELKEDEEVVRRGKILNFGSVELPDLVGQELTEAEVGVIPKREKEERSEITINVTKKEQELSPEDEEKLYKAEKDWLKDMLKQHMRSYVKDVGDNNNPVPYKEGPIDGVSQLARRFARHLEDDWAGRHLEKGERMPDRIEKIIKRAEKLADWIEANGNMMKGAGIILHFYYDGLQGMEQIVGLPNLRYDIKMDDDLFEQFSALSSESRRGTELEGEWKLAEEIVRKQDETYSIMRSIAGVHRHQGRNGGKAITPQLRVSKGEIEDYKVNNKQIKFIESVFGSFKEVRRTEKEGDQEIEVSVEVSPIPIKAISKILNGEEAREELKRFFERGGDGAERRSVVIGRSHEITRETVRTLKNNPTKLGGEVVWIDGVAWPINKDTRNEVIKELRWRIGSGDQVFVGKEVEVGSDDYKKKVKKGAREVAMIQEIAPALDNPYVMTRAADKIEATNKKIEWILNQTVNGESLWETLKRDDIKIDVEAQIRRFNDGWEDWQRQEVDMLDEHIIDMARIGLLGAFAEGSELGWGFEYETKRIAGKKIKVTKDLVERWTKLMEAHKDTEELEAYTLILDEEEKDLNQEGVLPEIKRRLENNEKVEVTMHTIVNKRSVVAGGTKSATDYSLPFHMLRTNASDSFKAWLDTTIPLPERVARQILAHEPGWRPRPDKNGEWRLTVLGKPIDIGIPAKFDSTLLNAIRIGRGEHKDKTFFQLVNEGTDMSELPYKIVDRDAIYKRGIIDWSQQFKILSQLKNAPNAPIGSRDTRSAIQIYYGPLMLSEDRTQEAKDGNKRLSLASRNFGGEKDVEKLTSYLQGTTAAWRLNLLPSSPKLGTFTIPDVKDVVRNTSHAIRGVVVRGDYRGGTRKAERFKKYMKQFLDLGEVADKANGRAKGKGISLEEFINEKDQKLTKI